MRPALALLALAIVARVGADAAAAEEAPAQLAALRAEGPPALERLLRSHDAACMGSPLKHLERQIDAVAAQRHAAASRLFWHTDLGAARSVARSSGRPILSLRLLGRLDEERSCANSRFFRAGLYPHAEVGRLLRERFVLHWSSERPAPSVTIDFGDGRRIETTVTGNSAHYVLDAEARPLDVLPGLYAPSVFVEELQRSLALHDALAALRGEMRTAALIAHHRQRHAERAAAWSGLGSLAVIDGARWLQSAEELRGELARAQGAAMAKAMPERALLRIVDVGADPGGLGGEPELWCAIGQRLFGIGESAQIVEVGVAIAQHGRARRPSPPSVASLPRVLDDAGRALVRRIAAAVPPGIAAPTPEQLDRVVMAFEQAMVADSAQNELVLRQRIRERIVGQPDEDFAALNAWVYAEVFRTPAGDAWLGLLPREAFTGLAGDGVHIAGAR